MADQFNEVISGQPDSISSRMDPKVYVKRKHLIMATDEKLNQFQVSPNCQGFQRDSSVQSREIILGMQNSTLWFVHGSYATSRLLVKIVQPLSGRLP